VVRDKRGVCKIREKGYVIDASTPYSLGLAGSGLPPTISL
jgi:hypothetical protein